MNLGLLCAKYLLSPLNSFSQEAFPCLLIAPLKGRDPRCIQGLAGQTVSLFSKVQKSPMLVAPVKRLYVAAHRLSWACAQLSGTHPGCSAREDFLAGSVPLHPPQPLHPGTSLAIGLAQIFPMSPSNKGQHSALGLQVSPEEKRCPNAGKLVPSSH